MKIRSWVALMLVLLMLCGCSPDAPVTQPPPVTTAPTLETTVPMVPQQTEPSTEPSAPTAPSAPTEPSEPAEPAPQIRPVYADLVKVSNYIPDIRQYLYYATSENFTGERIYAFEDAYLRYGTVQKLKLVQQELAQYGFGLMIWDGYRPVSAQARLWEICPDPAFVSPPDTGNRSHCRGSAVDVTLVDLETGEELEMPSDFDEFSALGDRDYSDCSAEAAANAALLEEIMVRYGFKPYSAEWWHYTDTEDYPIEENFDPAMGLFWYVDCQEAVALRAEPEDWSSVLADIPDQMVVRLLGWNRRFAMVEYEGVTGYILASHLSPVDQNYLETALDTVPVTDCYTYEQMMADLSALEAANPGNVSLDTIGSSEMGRALPVLILGDPDAPHHVLIHGSIHAREHACTWLIMALLDYWTDHGLEDYGDVCFHVIPMVNPDGVTIVQTGMLPETLMEVYQRDLELEYTDLELEAYIAVWKANGLGVDLNRNFDAAWEEFEGREAPSSERYKGDAVCSAAESRALRDYTLRYDFDVTVSYHAMGSIIYWQYGHREDVNNASLDLSQMLGAAAGYPSIGSGNDLDAAGYKDWVMDDLGIPSVTIEIGSESAPLSEGELDVIFARNLQILPEIAAWVQNRDKK